MPSDQAIKWFKTSFSSAIARAMAGTPFTIDMMAALACQETGYIWARLLRKGMAAEQILPLCVGDTIDAKPNNKGRRVFPKNRSELEKHPQGRQMFGIARSSLERMSAATGLYQSSVDNPDKFCRGYGIFQFDLQYFKKGDADFFLEQKWHDFDGCLSIARRELLEALAITKKKPTDILTDLETAYVAIAYNSGKFNAAAGLKQGHLDDDGRYYGELFYDFLLRSKTITASAADQGTARRINARRGLNLRGGPGTTFPVLQLLPFGTQVFVLSIEGDWALVDLQGDSKSDGFVHRSFLDSAG